MKKITVIVCATVLLAACKKVPVHSNCLPCYILDHYISSKVDSIQYTYITQQGQFGYLDSATIVLFDTTWGLSSPPTKMGAEICVQLVGTDTIWAYANLSGNPYFNGMQYVLTDTVILGQNALYFYPPSATLASITAYAASYPDSQVVQSTSPDRYAEYVHGIYCPH